jgi:hypothetical protein
VPMWSGMGGKLVFYNARGEHSGEKTFFKDVLVIRRIVFSIPRFQKRVTKKMEELRPKRT